MDSDLSAVDRLTTSIEDFNSVFIRLPTVGRLSFSALSVLHSLSRRGPTRLTDLVRTEQIKQPALTAVVAKLENDGLVSRQRDPADGRASLLSLTDAGSEIVRGRHEGRVERLGALVERLSPADRRTLLAAAEVLDRIVEIARTREDQHSTKEA